MQKPITNQQQLNTYATANLIHYIYRVARDPRFERLPCSHKGTYADDCIVNRVMQHKCYIVATCDRDLKRRIRKIPGIHSLNMAYISCLVLSILTFLHILTGVPIMYIASRKYAIERLPETPML